MIPAISSTESREKVSRGIIIWKFFSYSVTVISCANAGSPNTLMLISRLTAPSNRSPNRCSAGRSTERYFSSEAAWLLSRCSAASSSFSLFVVGSCCSAAASSFSLFVLGKRCAIMRKISLNTFPQKSRGIH
ncbi:uncharacterized protein BYT42DRAFT_174959 [Radiomyces spectabilis]|uniref:uncharacterized protein n=1 Tax=Radiomyces spectabilis TaxID=64574 RepID=UPI0022209239|nr:uncharacterized protein BYT42DRAFT_174959 [Radiomyces spectabilis]KAI8390930.1 hypothetical protein BYT42DRAFT_174959 [Radiomyces spectabilis]